MISKAKSHFINWSGFFYKELQHPFSFQRPVPLFPTIFFTSLKSGKKGFPVRSGLLFQAVCSCQLFRIFFPKKHAFSKSSEFWGISTSISLLRMLRKRNLHKIGTLLHEIGTLLHEIGSLLHEIGTLLHEIRSLLHEIRSLLHEIGTLLHEIGTLLQEWCDFDLNAYLC